jgi:hypothetical protein
MAKKFLSGCACALAACLLAACGTVASLRSSKTISTGARSAGNTQQASGTTKPRPSGIQTHNAPTRVSLKVPRLRPLHVTHATQASASLACGVAGRPSLIVISHFTAAGGVSRFAASDYVVARRTVTLLREAVPHPTTAIRRLIRDEGRLAAVDARVRTAARFKGGSRSVLTALRRAQADALRARLPSCAPELPSGADGTE